MGFCRVLFSHPMKYPIILANESRELQKKHLGRAVLIASARQKATAGPGIFVHTDLFAVFQQALLKGQRNICEMRAAWIDFALLNACVEGYANKTIYVVACKVAGIAVSDLKATHFRPVFHLYKIVSNALNF